MLSWQEFTPDREMMLSFSYLAPAVWPSTRFQRLRAMRIIFWIFPFPLISSCHRVITPMERMRGFRRSLLRLVTEKRVSSRSRGVWGTSLVNQKNFTGIFEKAATYTESHIDYSARPGATQFLIVACDYALFQT